MTIQADTRYLHGYAAKLDANKDGALVAIEQYCREHCNNFDGLDGTLYPARLGLGSLVDSILDMCDAAKRGLWLTAYDLRGAAKSYDDSDRASAERLWTVGRAWSAPTGYHELDLDAADPALAGGANVALPVPPFHSEVGQVKGNIHDAVGFINDWVARLTGYDLLEKLLPLALGDSGAVRRIGAAWGEAEHAFLAVGRDLERGMDVLSTHWTSDVSGAGGASSAFDYHIRRRWVPAFEALGQVCDAGQQLCEAMADAYEYVVNALLFAVNYYSVRIKKMLRSVLTAKEWTTILWRLWELVSTLWDLITDTFELLVKQTMMFKEMVEMAVANVVTLRNLMRGDLDALKTL